jgi:glutathione synthase/RimK-type ligase-like ATP-grasp enzyme
MKNIGYSVAGLDFIFDKKGKAWFIEANSASTVHKEVEEVYGEPLTVKAIAKYINSLPGKNFCIFQRKSHQFKEEKENSAWLPTKLKEYVNKDFHVCYMNSNLRVSRNFFPDHNFVKLTLTNFKRGGGNSYVLNSHRRKVKPDVVMRNYFQLNPEFESEGVRVINTMAARDLVWFKHKCYDAVKKIKGINIPPYFLINNNSEFKKVLQENKKLFKDGYVLKPLGDSLGRGVKVANSNRMLRNFEVKPGYMIQKRIHQPMVEKNKYWDVRCFVVNGKYITGIKRVSKNKVTNIAQGGHGAKLEDKYQKKIARVSEKIAEEINKQAIEWIQSDHEYIYTPKKPTLREVRWHPVGEE